MSVVVPSSVAASNGPPATALRQRQWRRANFAIGAVLVAAVIGLALLSFVWTPHPPTELDIPHKLQPPSWSHWLGTDSLGRDIVSLLIVGSRVSIAVGLIAVGIGIAFGVALGLLAAVTNSRERTTSALARVMRANTGTLKMPIATIEVTRPGP